MSNPLPQALASASLSRAAGRSLTSIRSQEELELLDPRRRFLGLVDGVLVLRELALEEEEELELEVRVCRLFLVHRVDLDLVDGSDKDGLVVLETFAIAHCTTC